MSPSSEQPAESRQPLPRTVKLLGGASLLTDIATEMVYPLLPSFLLTVLGGNKFQLGLIEGVADSTASILKLFAGGWSDRAGKRRGFVIFGYSLSGLVRPLIGTCGAPWQLFVIRTADRIGKGIRTAPRDALIADCTDPRLRGRAFGFHRAMDHLGAAIGPVVAVAFLWLWPDQLRALFLLALAPGILVVALLLIGLRKTPATTAPQERLRLTLKPFDRNFRLFLLALVVFTLGNSSDAFLLVRAGELGVPTATLPLLWCAFHILKSFGNWLAGRAVDKYGPRPFIFLGWFSYAGIYLAFALATTTWEAWACFLGYAVYYSLAEPAEHTFVANLAGSERKGLAFGWYNFAIGIVSLPSSLIFGALYEKYGAQIAFGSGAVLALLAAGIMVGVRQNRMEKPTPVPDVEMPTSDLS